MRFKLCVMRSGFTLMEVIVAVGIFAIASVIISTVYFNANNLHRQTASFQRLQNEGRYLMEKVARETRAREIAYPVEPLQPQEILNFQKDEIGEEVAIAVSADGKNLEYRVNGAAANLNASDIEVVDAKFYIVPNTASQWGADPTTNLQPRVTFLLKIKNKAVNPRFVRELTLQTTISSKVYKR